CFFFSSRRRHTRCYRDWSSDVCSSDLHVECEHVVVDRHAKEFAVIDRCRASVESGTLDPRFELDWRAPDLPAGCNVDGEGPPARSEERRVGETCGRGLTQYEGSDREYI